MIDFVTRERNNANTDKGKMQEMIGEYDLKFSKTYGFWYVEKEVIDFIGRR